MRSLSFVGLVLLIGIVACASLGVAVAGDEEMCVPMGIITLEPPDSVEAKRAVVDFQHGLAIGEAAYGGVAEGFAAAQAGRIVVSERPADPHRQAGRGCAGRRQCTGKQGQQWRRFCIRPRAARRG